MHQHISDAHQADRFHSTFTRAISAPFGVHRVHGAGQARIEGVDGAQHLERLLRIGDRVADQRGLVRARAGPCRRAGRRSRWRGRPPGSSRSCRRRSPPSATACRAAPRGSRSPRISPLGNVGGLKMARVALADVVDQELPVLQRQLRDHRGSAPRARRGGRACECSTAGVSFVLAMLPAVSSTVVAQRLVGSCPAANADQDLRASGPTCIGLAVEAGRLHPASTCRRPSKSVYCGLVSPS